MVGTVEPKTKEVTIGQPWGELPVPTGYAGHELDYWYIYLDDGKQPGFGSEQKKITATDKVVRPNSKDGNKVHAMWKEAAFKVTYELDSGTNNEQNVAEFTTKKTPIELQPATKEGYVFQGW